MTYEPSYTMWYCEECQGSRPCYCLMESVFTPQLCIDERGPEGAVWKPLRGRVAQNVFGQLNVSDVKYYEARESE